MQVNLKRRSTAVQVPQASPTPLKRLVGEVFSFPNDIPNIVKTKKFIEARMEGKNVRDANAFAGIPLGKVQALTLASPAAQVLLEELIKEKIPDIDVSHRLKDMWDARREVRTKKGVIDLGPDREMQKYAMDKRLALGGYVNGNLPEDRGGNAPVTNITFNTIQVKGVEEIK